MERENSFGYFQNNGSEFVVTERETPRALVNYSWNKKFISGVSQHGGGDGVYKERTMQFIDQRGRNLMVKNGHRYFYIHDCENEKVWSPGWHPVQEELDTFKCIHGLGYSKFESSKEKFIENAKKYKGDNTIKVFNSHFLLVDKTDIKNIDLFFYDADHSFEMNRQVIKYFADTLVNEAVLIFDDANFDGVVDGVKTGILEAGLEIIYEKILLNSLEDPEMWWNGFYIAIVKK